MIRFNSRFLILIGLLLLSTLGCKEIKVSKGKINSHTVHESFPCFDKESKEDILLAIFQTERIVKKHLDPVVRNGNYGLPVLSTDFFTKDLEVNYFGNLIKLVDSSMLTDKTYRIEVLAKNCQDNSLEFRVTCPYEGKWYTRGIAKKKTNHWNIEILSGGIAD